MIAPGAVLSTAFAGQGMTIGPLPSRDPPTDGAHVTWGPRFGPGARVLVLAVVEPGGVKPDAPVLAQGGKCGWTWSDDAAWTRTVQTRPGKGACRDDESV